jgi:hypothetical protein
MILDGTRLSNRTYRLVDGSDHISFNPALM